MTVCTVPGCGCPHKARGWCITHYRAARRAGAPVVRALGEPPLNRVLRRVAAGPNGCWIWTGPVDEDGYGRGSRDIGRVHRFTYTTLRGSIPNGMELDHLCAVRACCNPEHLEAVTHIENVRRGRAAVSTQPPGTPTQRQSTISHCARGHEFTPQNTRWKSDGHRACRECNRLRYHAARAS